MSLDRTVLVDDCTQADHPAGEHRHVVFGGSCAHGVPSRFTCRDCEAGTPVAPAVVVNLHAGITEDVVHAMGGRLHTVAELAPADAVYDPLAMSRAPELPADWETRGVTLPLPGEKDVLVAPTTIERLLAGVYVGGTGTSLGDRVARALIHAGWAKATFRGHAATDELRTISGWSL